MSRKGDRYKTLLSGSDIIAFCEGVNRGRADVSRSRKYKLRPRLLKPALSGWYREECACCYRSTYYRQLAKVEGKQLPQSSEQQIKSERER